MNLDLTFTAVKSIISLTSGTIYIPETATIYRITEPPIKEPQLEADCYFLEFLGLYKLFIISSKTAALHLISSLNTLKYMIECIALEPKCH